MRRTSRCHLPAVPKEHGLEAFVVPPPPPPNRPKFERYDFHMPDSWMQRYQMRHLSPESRPGKDIGGSLWFRLKSLFLILSMRQIAVDESESNSTHGSKNLHIN